LGRRRLRGLITAVIAEEDVSAGKPDPEGNLMVAFALNRPSHGILVFEDSIPGI
jgi:beta-phosphoglucomutase